MTLWKNPLSRLMLSIWLCAGMAALADAQGSKNDPMKTQIGLQLYSVREDCAKDLPGVLKAVAKMGYTGVEFAGYYGHTAQELRKMMDENGLKCYGTHIALDTMLGDNLAKTIEFNKILGNKLLIVPSLPNSRRNSKAALLETAALFNDIAKKLEPEGMAIGFHNHATEFKPVDGETPWEVFFANTDKRVIIQFDTGNAMSAGVQPAPYLAKYPGRVWSAHVKDFSATNPKALLGEGDVHWNEVMPLLRGKAGTRYFIIEQETYPYPPLECAEKCLHTLEGMLKNKAAANR